MTWTPLWLLDGLPDQAMDVGADLRPRAYADILGEGSLADNGLLVGGYTELFECFGLCYTAGMPIRG